MPKLAGRVDTLVVWERKGRLPDGGWGVVARRVLYEDSGPFELETEAAMDGQGPHAEVELGRDVKVNMGNYESILFHGLVRLPCPVEQWREVYEATDTEIGQRVMAHRVRLVPGFISEKADLIQRGLCTINDIHPETVEAVKLVLAARAK